MRRAVLWSVLLFATLSSTCGGDDDPYRVDVSRCGTACAVDEDCALILLGSPCRCGCEAAAVRADEAASCVVRPPRPECDGEVTCAACAERAVCSGGVCAVVSP